MNSEKFFYQELITKELARRIDKNSSYSLRSFALSIQIDPGALSSVLNGKKLLTPFLTDKVMESLSLSPKEKDQFLDSVANSYIISKRKKYPQAIKELLKKKSETLNKKTQNLSEETFRVIADWYHYAILQMVKNENFNLEISEIAKKLEITPTATKFAIERLKKLNLLIEKGGTLFRTENPLSISDLSKTTPALRKRIKQITQKSTESLENDPISIRNHTTMTMSIDPDLLPEAKERIQKFMDELSDFLEAKNKKVYELQINLFPLEK